MATLNEPTFQSSRPSNRPFVQFNAPNFRQSGLTTTVPPPSITNRPATDSATTTTTTTTTTTKVSKPKSSITIFDILKMTLIGGLVVGWIYMVYRFMDEKSTAVQDYIYFVDVKDWLFQLIVVLMLIFIWAAVRFKSTPAQEPVPDQCSLKNKQKIANAQKQLSQINKLTTDLTTILNDGNCNVAPAPVPAPLITSYRPPPRRKMPAPPVPEPIKKAAPSCRPRIP